MRQMRWTELALIPTAFAIIVAVQWVASAGGSVRVSATTRLAKAKQRERERLWMLPSSSLFAWRHDEVPESLQIAFKEFQLNGADPLHWNHLLKLLAEVIYGKDEKKGPPKRWTDESLMGTSNNVRF